MNRKDLVFASRMHHGDDKSLYSSDKYSFKKREFKKQMNRVLQLASFAILIGQSAVSSALSVDLNIIGDPLTAPYGVRAVPNESATDIRVEFVVDGNVLRTESTAPYCANSDDGTNCLNANYGAGTHTFVANVYAQTGSALIASASKTVKEGNPAAWLVFKGDPAKGQPYSIEARTRLTGDVKILFLVDGVAVRTESGAPYCLTAEGNGVCIPGLRWANGNHKVEIRVMPENGTNILAQASTVFKQGAAITSPPPSPTPRPSATPVPSPTPAPSPTPGPSPTPPVSQVSRCTGAPSVNVNPSTIGSALSTYAGRSVILNLQPGTYGRLSVDRFQCIEVKCSVAAIISGAANPNGCRMTKAMHVSALQNAIFENLVFDADTSQNPDGSADYSLAIYTSNRVRVANNFFAGKSYHGVSLKEQDVYTEVMNNYFARCNPHCIEAGQNGNVPSRPSTCGTLVARGNTFVNASNAITLRHIQKTIIDRNTFRNTLYYSVESVPFWALYDYGRGPEPLLVSPAPYRTEITNNNFIGASKINWEGRGVSDDVILMKDNTGTLPTCRGFQMSQRAIDAHSNEQTIAAPMLDRNSNFSCPGLR